MPPLQILGLEYLYNSTNGRYWRWQSLSSGAHWNFESASPNPCLIGFEWQGIECHCQVGGACNVVAINLQSYNLSGVMSGNISVLSTLTSLILDSNRVFSPLPTSIGTMTHLVVLSMVLFLRSWVIWPRSHI